MTERKKDKDKNVLEGSGGAFLQTSVSINTEKKHIMVEDVTTLLRNKCTTEVVQGNYHTAKISYRITLNLF